MNVQFFLLHQPVEFDVIPHRDAYDANHLAQALHVPGKNVAKTVLLRADGGERYFVAVLPANRRIELSRLNHFLWGYQLELATEGEIARNCTDCEVGVLPPFGSQYGLTTIMDRSLLQADEIVFEGNNHREAIRMKLEDFQIIEQPLICSFSE
jgi:Ala-tRNA(Pro) deacylase